MSSDELPYTVGEWGDGYWRWQCRDKRKHGCSGIVGPLLGRDGAEAAAAQHRLDVHEGLVSDLRRGTAAAGETQPPYQPGEQSIRRKGIAHGLAWFAERASQQRRSDA